MGSPDWVGKLLLGSTMAVMLAGFVACLAVVVVPVETPRLVRR
jgi:hypothetical protein